MDLVDVVILALRLLLVALLYLFLFLVIRAGMRGLRTGRAAVPDPVRSTARLDLVVIEPGTSTLSAGEVLAVADGTTLGRSDEADVVLLDTAVSAQHARLERVGRKWAVTDLGSTNGTRVNDAIVQKRTLLAEGDVLSLGTVRLQVTPRVEARGAPY